MLAPKGLGCISLCMHVCGNVHLCVCVCMYMRTYRRATVWLACMKMSQFHGPQRPRSPTYSSSPSMQMVGILYGSKRKCASYSGETRSYARRVAKSFRGRRRLKMRLMAADCKKIYVALSLCVPCEFTNPRTALPFMCTEQHCACYTSDEVAGCRCFLYLFNTSNPFFTRTWVRSFCHEVWTFVLTSNDF